MRMSQLFKLKILLVLGFIIILAGCAAQIKVNLKLADEIPASGTFKAGAAKVDITPPPGYPMGGFAIAGRMSRGWWTRLYAKAIYLEDRDGNRLVMVSCDLWSLPGGLADKVAEIVSRKSETAHLGREQLIIAATHTHHSPGNFSTSRAYNMLASPQMGFDKSLFNFLAHRIAYAITQATLSRKPAIVKMGAVQLPGLSRNRSIEAFLENHTLEKDAILSRVSNPDHFFTSDLPPSVTTPMAFQAVDPKLTVLKVEALGSHAETPIAVAAFFSIHPTAMGPETEVYSSDIFGVATTLVEQHLRNKYKATVSTKKSTVVAMFNGAEGDISPNWKKQDRLNTVEIGQGIAKGILTAIDSASTIINGTIGYRFENVDISDKEVNDIHHEAEFLCSSAKGLKTAKNGRPGVATLGGAEDGRSLFYYWGFREGITAPICTPRHGNKYSAVKELLQNVLHINQDKVIGKFVANLAEFALDKSAPKKLLIGVYSVGPLILGTLPGECTMALGYRITQTLRQSTGDEKTILLVGLANEYLSYFTTPKEYSVQHYEGASTMYGQVSGLYLEQELGRIANLPTNTANYKLKKKYKVGDKAGEEFGVIKMNDHWKIEQALANIIQDPKTCNIRRNFPQFTWTDSVVFLKEKNVNPLQRVNPIVSIQRKSNDGSWEPLEISYSSLADSGVITVVESDTASLNFVNVVPLRVNNLLKWHSIWMPPSNMNTTQTLRFCAETPDTFYYSQAFHVSAILKAKPEDAIIPKN